MISNPIQSTGNPDLVICKCVYLDQDDPIQCYFGQKTAQNPEQQNEGFTNPDNCDPD